MKKWIVLLTGLDRSNIYAFMEDAEFPKRVLIGGRAVCWFEHEVQEWIEDKIAIRDGI